MARLGECGQGAGATHRETGGPRCNRPAGTVAAVRPRRRSMTASAQRPASLESTNFFSCAAGRGFAAAGRGEVRSKAERGVEGHGGSQGSQREAEGRRGLRSWGLWRGVLDE
jgi:hypothetical protein